MSALQQFLDDYAAEWGDNDQSKAAAAELDALHEKIAATTKHRNEYQVTAVKQRDELAALRARVATLEADRRQLFGVAVRAFNAVESLGVTSNELPGKLPELDRYLANEIDDKLWDEIEAARAAVEEGR